MKLRDYNSVLSTWFTPKAGSWDELARYEFFESASTSVITKPIYLLVVGR